MAQRILKYIIVIISCYLLGGCSLIRTDTDCEMASCVGKGLDSFEIVADYASRLPLTVAVMPFENDTKFPEARELVRQAFYRHFSSKKYRDIELFEVDALLQRSNLYEGSSSLDISPQEMGKLMQADGLIYGKITGYNKLYLLLYSQVYVEMEVKMLESTTGEVLWQAKHRITHHEGEIPLQLLSILSAVFRTSINVSDNELLRTADELCRTITAALPDPESMNILTAGTLARQPFEKLATPPNLADSSL